MDIRKIKKLIEVVEDSDVAEIEISTADETIRIARFTWADLRNPSYILDAVRGAGDAAGADSTVSAARRRTHPVRQR